MSNKQRLQVNNTNLSDIFAKIGDLPLKALVEAAAREGQFVWKKLAAEGGTFLDYVVNDSETAYPDGGMQDGYWYERVSEGIDLLGIFGYTKMAVDEFTFTADTQYSAHLNHSLGTYPKFAMVLRDATVCKPYAVVIATALSWYSKPDVQLYETKDSTSNKRYAANGVGDSAALMPNYVQMGVYTTRGKYMAGIKYTLITMA